LRAAGLRVMVIDKGRGVGGRMATRRLAVDDGAIAACDHGAQFFTVRDARFEGIVREWIAAGVAREWARGFADPAGHAREDGHPRYCGVGGMNAIARHLAGGLEARVSEQVVELAHDERQWRAKTKDGDGEERSFAADALILTPPVPQSLALLATGNARLPAAARDKLEALRYDPCIAVLAALDAPSRLPFPGAMQINLDPIQWLADNQRKGASDLPTVTIHATPSFSLANWDAPLETTGDALLQAAAPWLGARAIAMQVHRWRYSQPVALHPDPCLFLADPAPLLFAGDAFGGPRVEGAVLSGLAAAEHLLHWLHR
jgi:predicted NAD/FAD-dependent oxidoreductase